MSTRYICVHGHFYQPPRENPWLEEVEREESARPFHDWNARITHECYAPNAFARILDGGGRIRRVVSNYSRISFNVGPTLLAWLERKAPETYEAIVAADREGAERFSGHGSAMAQPYNHMILPLASPRDRRTQILWGIRDFQTRFGRDPRGMWLPETAVDLKTLDLMAGEGIHYTVLAPHQAAAVREEDGWRELSEDQVDTSRPYRVSLPSGGEIAVFFYDGPLSRAVAFERLLSDGKAFADRLMEAAASHGGGGLAHIATDGETYGHHHRHGEMALAWALDRIDQAEDVALTNYGEHLERTPPSDEVRIRENSSWSCAHGTERWRRDCGCATGAHPEWSQAWREPLRQALDWLRDRLVPLYAEAMGELVHSPWGARNRYIEVILDRSPDHVQSFLAREAKRTPGDGETTRILKLLELQRQALLMYTSCGWFFDDIGGIESLQVLKYAARALHLSSILFDEELEEEFREHLSGARSNLPEGLTGRKLYETRVEPLRVNLAKVAAHSAVFALFEPAGDEDRTVYCYSVRSRDELRHTEGQRQLAMGRLQVTSLITRSAAEYSFGVLHMGDHNLVGGVRSHRGQDAYAGLVATLSRAFHEGEVAELVRILDQEFHAATYSLRSLFHDEQERVVERILEDSLIDAEGVLADLYESRASLMRFLAEREIPQPAPFRLAGEFIVNTRLRRALRDPEPDADAAAGLVDEAVRNRLALDQEGLDYAVSEVLHRLLRRLEEEPEDASRLHAVEKMATFVERLPFHPELWWAQNTWFRMHRELLPRFTKAVRDDEEGDTWVTTFREVGRRLGISVPPM